MNYSDKEIKRLEKKAKELKDKKKKKKDGFSNLAESGGLGLVGLLINKLRK